MLCQIWIMKPSCKPKQKLSKELFLQRKNDLTDDEDFKTFFDKNKSWLVPYAAFCYLKETNGTADFRIWKTYGKYTKLAIDRLASPQSKQYDQISYLLFCSVSSLPPAEEIRSCMLMKTESSLKEIYPSAFTGIVVMPGCLRNCIIWIKQAGAPPDPFAVKGQNWGFPTYNWERMAKDSFQWWKNRFSQMAIYFDAFRIDHILGFFRIWSIPDFADRRNHGSF